MYRIYVPYGISRKLEDRLIASMPEALATAQSIATELQYECLVIRTNQMGYGQVVAVVEAGGQVR
ncbi:MAG: hypothetical protein AMXMBFR7_02000 [Planctomycetota bacterium]